MPVGVKCHANTQRSYAGEILYLQLDDWERDRSIVRERCRKIGQEIFELSCQLQEQFDVKDMQEALVLVREWKTLKGAKRD